MSDTWKLVEAGKFEHKDKPGVYLVYENYSWKIYRDGQEIAQNRAPSNPFVWGGRLAKNNIRGDDETEI